MKIFITGGLGFVGSHLCQALLQSGHEITAVGRRRTPGNMINHPLFTYLSADTTKPGEWQQRLADQEVVVNLAGKSIFTLWTEKARKEIYDSRILTTRNLAEGLAGRSDVTFLSTSAIGYYGDRGDDLLTEDQPPGSDFLAMVSRDWEREALQAAAGGNRVVLMRFGIVFDRDGGALASMIPAFKFFLGGRLGSGKQWFPWIHMDDLVAACAFAMDQPDLSGPANFCAPQPVRNADLTRMLAGKLKRPVMLPTPSWMMRGLLGQFGQTLLNSQRGKPEALLQSGFSFTYETLETALDELLKN
ncbi:TIGR01777 family oxidoreductase [Desulfofustis glycolicus]|uniref:TIGR01777 family protein n=1 Tax=Desulfofustis glycolicus DSM 9705 TaxID=1121409 RepID=A0A1M5YBP0_9BACT|nr:TIGR01777 family oxidoreductase [Desulfofustis glycolicus]MCB2217754.1 TIGR01777 family oxidoreductase [Desulfobulbaceae bacterium]SHI09501.1 hypothetical protein SAMN02745124_03845 [Desulfofustis glycolicus DSM 9705]